MKPDHTFLDVDIGHTVGPMHREYRSANLERIYGQYVTAESQLREIVAAAQRVLAAADEQVAAHMELRTVLARLGGSA